MTLLIAILVVPAPSLDLELIAAWPLDGMENAQPSGLTLANGVLFAVSDKHDHAIHRIDLDEEGARIEPFITFNAPWSGKWSMRLDFEGIAYADGSFYLVSESCDRVLHVNENGGDLEWVTPTVEDTALEAGLFGVKNAHLEGIALLGPRHFLLAAEREPRGLIEVRWVEGEDEPRLSAWQTEATILDLPEGQVADFADLHTDEGGLYALVRSADAVVPINWTQGELEELDVWSFRHVVANPRYAYVDQISGRAEGLTMDEERIYIVLDNNGRARVADEADTRPQLLVFARPD